MLHCILILISLVASLVDCRTEAFNLIPPAEQLIAATTLSDDFNLNVLELVDNSIDDDAAFIAHLLAQQNQLSHWLLFLGDDDWEDVEVADSGQFDQQHNNINQIDDVEVKGNNLGSNRIVNNVTLQNSNETENSESQTDEPNEAQTQPESDSFWKKSLKLYGLYALQNNLMNYMNGDNKETESTQAIAELAIRISTTVSTTKTISTNPSTTPITTTTSITPITERNPSPVSTEAVTNSETNSDSYWSKLKYKVGGWVG